MSIDRGMDEEVVVHMYNGILVSRKKERVVPFAETWMDLESVKQSEVRKRKPNIV